MTRVLALVAAAAALAGCDTLFPEFSGGNKPAPSDAGCTDAGCTDAGPVAAHLAGAVCILADARDYRSCATGSPGALRITVEETRDVTMTDIAGNFTLPLASTLATATVGIVDPRGYYATSIVPVRLVNGSAANVALAVVATQTLSNLALQNGAVLDATQGSLLAWAVDSTGVPVAGVTFAQPSALVDGAAANELTPGVRTGARGAIALLQVAPRSLTLALTPPPTLAPDNYALPIRPGALTISTLILLPH
jgi:hypothetical protein